jgi:hypothetical protein
MFKYKVAKFFGSFTLSIVEYFLNAYVLTVLWSWFIVSTFHLPALTIYAAMGLTLVVAYLTKQPDFTGQEIDDYATKMKVYGIIRPLLALFMGWSIKICM